MQAVEKTKEELVAEVVHLRQRVAELEQSEIKRKQAEEALRKSEEKYRTVVEISPDGIAIASKGRHVFANKSLAKMFGVSSPDELRGKPLMDYIHPDYRKVVKERLDQQTKRSELVPLIEEKMLRADGTVIHTEVAAAPLKYEGEQAVLAVIRDITERKQTEDALRESEERYRTLVNNINLGINLIDVDHSIVMANAAKDRHFNRSVDDVVGKKCFREFEKRDTVCPHCPGVQAMATGQPAEAESEGVGDDGNPYHVRIQAFPVFGDDDTVTGFIEIAENITERKRMEQELRESEEKYRSLVESSEDSIYLVNRNCNYIFLNNRHLARLGVQSSQIIGKGYSAFHTPEESKDFAKRIKTVLKTGKPQYYEYRSQRDNKYFIRTLNPVISSDREINAITVISKDITERKQAEEALQESENRFRLLVEHSVDAFVLHDIDGKIIDVNQHTCESLGYTREELLGLYVHDIDQNVAPGKHIEKWEQVVPGKPITLEGVHKRKDGTTFPVEIRLGAFVSGGRKLMLGLVRDVTERKEAEEKLKESEERFRTIFETAPGLIFIKDRNLKFTAINLAMEKYYDVSASEVVGRTSVVLFGKKIGERSMEEDVRALEGEIINTEHSFQIQGNTVIQSVVKVPMRNSAGEIIGLCGTARDITESKKAEEMLREREAFNYALFHYNPVETVAVDTEGKVTAFNLAKEKSGDRLPTIGERMYKDYAGKHEIDMRAELMKCISSGKRKKFLDRKYGDRHLTITISPFAQGAIIISEDITERKRAEEALRESEQFSSSLLNESPNPIIVINPDTSIRYVNPALEKLTGFSEAELIGRKAPYPWWSDEIVSEIIIGLKRAIQQGSQRREYQFQTKSGSQFWVEITSEPVMHDGKVQYLLTNWIDITERKRAEELLQKERDTFFSILEKAPYGVMVVDAEGNHTFVNSEFTNITGYTLGDIPTTQEWLHRAYPDQHYRNMVTETWGKDYTQNKVEETFRKQFGRVFSRAFNVKCKDGTAKEIEFRTAFIGDEGTMFMLSDITERQRMHALLESVAAQWRTTFDAISDAVCLLDSHGKIIRCNNAMLKLVEKPFSDITNHHCWEVMHGVSEAPHNCPIALAGKTNHRESEVMFKNSCWFNISVDPLLDEEGNFVGGVHIMSDISDRMRIQNELQDSREQLRNLTVHLESVREQERTNIAREIHDELAQALTALRMDVSWLDRRLPADAQSLSEKTESMGNLIDSTIQTVKRISAELRPGVLDDLGLVAAIEWQAEEFQNRTGIRCRVTVDPDDIAVDQDLATAIFRIFQETLTNVARHARATRVTVNLKRRAGKLTLRVKDNGKGITEEQISGSQSFGLIGMQERVVPWNGKISFKGIPDKGTTVTVSVGLDLDHGKKNIDKNSIGRSPV